MVEIKGVNMIIRYCQTPRSSHSFTWKSHPLYNTWHQMRIRCYKPTSISYKNYGARGITIDPSWLYNFEQFVNDMGTKPSNSHTIERIDNNGNYCKSNCKWATSFEQNRNKRVYITSSTGHSGIRLTNAGTYQVRTVFSRTILGCFKTIEEAIVAQHKVQKNEAPRINNTTGGKGITFAHGRFQVRKLINGTRVYLGACGTIEEAKDLYLSGKVKEARSSSKTGISGINKKNGKFTVRKTINGVRKFIGDFKTLEEAKVALHEAR